MATHLVKLEHIGAAEIGLANGRIHYTRELSNLLVELGDRKRLDEIFGRILTQSKENDRDSYYPALVDYANGLAGFSDDRASRYFEEAIDFHPENNEEAINLYAEHLIGRGQGNKALELLDTWLTPEQRISTILPVFLRKRALQQERMETSSADAEIDSATHRLKEGAAIGYSSVEDSSSHTDMVMAAINVGVSTVFAVDNTFRVWKSQLYSDSTMSPWELFVID